MLKLNYDQYFEFGVSPERDLLIAIIKRAIEDLFTDDKYLVDSSKRWLFSREKSPYPAWSFGWVCEYLTNFDKDIDLKSMIKDYLSDYISIEIKKAA